MNTSIIYFLIVVTCGRYDSYSCRIEQLGPFSRDTCQEISVKVADSAASAKVDTYCAVGAK